MGALVSPLAQLAMSLFMAPQSRPAKGAIQRLLVGLLGLAAAALIGSVALVIFTFAFVIWVLPPGASPLEVNLLTAGVLALLALAIWYLTSQGQSPQQIVEEALEPPHHSPVESLSRSAHNLMSAFERGWQNTSSRRH